MSPSRGAPGSADGGLALAAAVRRGRGRRAAARCHPQAGQGRVWTTRHRAPGGDLDLRRAARRGDPLDRPGDGQDGRDLLALGAADLGARMISQPHRIRTFKRSTDPEFAAKLEDIVGLYVDPPKHAVVLSVDEKCQIQALDRDPARPAAQAGQGRHHDPRLSAQRRHQPVRRPQCRSTARCSGVACSATGTRSSCASLAPSSARVPAGKMIDVILDNYGSHKHPKVLAWLARQPRWTFHFTPTSGSWLNAVRPSSRPLRAPAQAGSSSVIDLKRAQRQAMLDHREQIRLGPDVDTEQLLAPELLRRQSCPRTHRAGCLLDHPASGEQAAIIR